MVRKYNNFRWPVLLCFLTRLLSPNSHASGLRGIGVLVFEGGYCEYWNLKF